MRRHLLYTLAFICFTQLPVAGQDLSRKFGKITDYEIDMTTYARDTSAVAVFLYENTDIWFDLTTSRDNLFQLQRNYSVKIKILKPDGVALADVEIPYYNSSGTKELISGFSISAYNRVNGKIVETKLKNSEILTEQVSENLYLRKFSIPEVRVGTVIEYKYAMSSDSYFDIDPVLVQHSYPVIYSYSRVSTPEFFTFNTNTQGHHRVSVQTSRNSHSGGNFTDNVRTIVGQDVPALNDEPFVWCVDDFRTKVTFELGSIAIPGAYYKDFTSSWKSIDETLREAGFDNQFKTSSPLKAEIAEIVAATDDEATRLRTILKLVSGRMNWNGSYSLFAKNPRQRFNEGSGSSADVNAILGGALLEAGFRPTAILLNPRHAGRLPYSHPSIDKINAFILMVDLSDGSRHILDATDPDNDVNLIPTRYMVDRARIYGADENKGWIDLTNLPVGKQNIIVNGTLDDSGSLTGSMTNAVTASPTYSLKSKYRRAASEEEYIESLETENQMTISSYTVEGLDAPVVTESVEFTKEAESAGDYIYMDATVIPFMSRNPLTQQERKLPIEFPYSHKNSLIALVAIPEGYAVEELPKSIRMNVCDGGADYLYYAASDGNRIHIRLEFNLNKVLFSVDEYPDLHTFFGMITEKNNSRIILKKL